ncbi:MAG: MFS transporter [Rhodospirillales bacterium]|nr:MFS transporter [Rhodospirillales bacterium]MBT4007575.1 MFS transporter [Rhodospirillales bacterium]MBT5076206.1 MFS transporter [Rhodospirillales bacterium]MBT5113289.1 MFS transporter [Rhodospirillales bacterium]MBT5671922.1 MFS transporter [Rhodospirillales bacterium]
MNASSARWKTPVVILLFGTIVLILSIGTRQTFGLFMEPISSAQGWGRESLAFAFATQNLVWGLSQPFIGAVADKWGSGKIIAGAGILYALGLYMMSQATSPGDVLLSNGLMIGFALSGCGYPIILAIVGRSVPEKRRSLFLGIASTGGSSGQLLVIPMAQVFISNYGWVMALILLALMTAFMVPLAAALTGKPKMPEGENTEQTLRQALVEARGHSGYILLTSGFFVCGWQIGFVTAHMPAYLSDHAIPISIAALSLAVIGFFNIIGTFTAGVLGGYFRQKYLLGIMYFLRSALFLVFLFMPINTTTVLIFSAVLGLLWLATVPLTSGLVAHIFGARYMATLYGIVFLSHQIGSFFGVWLGGILYDQTGSYNLIWWGSIGLGLIASLLHVSLNDEKVARPLASPTNA